MAARGALPLPPLELATVLFALMHDPDAEVKDTARASLEALPANVMDVVLAGDAHPTILSHLAHAQREDEARCEMLALNTATDDATIAFLATLPFKRVVDVVANNQERLMRAPEIVEALGPNPMVGRSVIDRILTFLGMDLADAEDSVGKGDLNESETEAALKAVLGEDLAGFAHQLVNESEETDVDEGDQTNLYALIQQMSIFQKVKLARLGNKEARGLLIRDRNKVVSVAAITSPKISDTEVTNYAQSRNVCDEVLRIIASNRTWCRNYKVKLALASNPKTPQPTAMKFVNYLQDNDLRAMVRSKDVPSQISAHARRILMKKGKI
ncbi:MAG: hypothetical protein JRH16_16230 [Deltaproteobacteria bacterium]|nr:hypothetical protein [Deltaproteobacteria bacterium]MBW2362137.1 hypothetical protein [Deltaproteobacteria bacterium]